MSRSGQTPMCSTSAATPLAISASGTARMRALGEPEKDVMLGQALARLEMQAMLTGLMQQVSRIELAGEPTWTLNNIIRCYERLPLRLISV